MNVFRMHIAHESTWYPPSKYIFMPIYKYTRRKTDSLYLAYAVTYGASIALHLSPLIFLGRNKLALVAVGTLALTGIAKLAWHELCRRPGNKDLEEKLDD